MKIKTVSYTNAFLSSELSEKQEELLSVLNVQTGTKNNIVSERNSCNELTEVEQGHTVHNAAIDREREMYTARTDQSTNKKPTYKVSYRHETRNKLLEKKKRKAGQETGKMSTLTSEENEKC